MSGWGLADYLVAGGAVLFIVWFVSGPLSPIRVSVRWRWPIYWVGLAMITASWAVNLAKISVDLIW